MIDRKEIIREVERRTYFSGVLKGKYRGELSFQNSDLSHETLYDIEIYEGFIETDKSSILKWSETQKIKELRSFFKHVKVYKAPLPKEIPLKIKDVDKDFVTPLYDLKIDFKEDSLFNHQIHDNDVYGEIEAKVFGYFVHIDEVIEYIDVPKEEPQKETKDKKPDINDDKEEKLVIEKEAETVHYVSLSEIISAIGGLLSVLLLVFLLLPIIIYGWKILLVVAFILLIVYLLSLFEAEIRIVASLLLNLLLLLIAGVFIYMLFSSVKITEQPNPIPLLVDNTHDTESEVTVVEPLPENPNDSLIIHYRVWKDYKDNEYSGRVEVYYNDFFESRRFRNNFAYTRFTETEYNRLVYNVYRFDRQALQRVYNMLDSIRLSNTMNRIEFAEVIVSFVQDIPYVLLLHNSCSPNQYNDSFITNYINSGGECVGYTKFGIHNPIEFAATLQGDCDTRTVFLFTILNNFGYDVAVLGSQLYSHSIIGINLPYYGTYKNVRGNKYYVWETTATGFKPGQIPREISNMNHWSVNLISTQL
jgi:hypothetical protein